MEELSNEDLENAHDSQRLNEMFEEEPKNYAYLIYMYGTTYTSIKKKEEYYIVKFEGIKPEEAIKRIKLKNLITQYSKILNKEDRQELDKCHKKVAEATMDIGISQNNWAHLNKTSTK